MQEPIEAFLEDVEASKSKSTHGNRTVDPRHYQAWLVEQGLQVTEAGPGDVHKFLREQGKQYAEGTVKNRYNSLKLLYEFLASPIREDIEESPFEDDYIERKKYSGNGHDKHESEGLVYVTPDEVDKLADNVGAPELRNELLVRLLFQTGVRRGEVSEMELKGIDRDEQSMSRRQRRKNTGRCTTSPPATSSSTSGSTVATEHPWPTRHTFSPPSRASRSVPTG